MCSVSAASSCKHWLIWRSWQTKISNSSWWLTVIWHQAAKRRMRCCHRAVFLLMHEFILLFPRTGVNEETYSGHRRRNKVILHQLLWENEDLKFPQFGFASFSESLTEVTTRQRKFYIKIRFPSCGNSINLRTRCEIFTHDEDYFTWDGNSAL